MDLQAIVEPPNPEDIPEPDEFPEIDDIYNKLEGIHDACTCKEQNED